MNGAQALITTLVDNAHPIDTHDAEAAPSESPPVSYRGRGAVDRWLVADLAYCRCVIPYMFSPYNPCMAAGKVPIKAKKRVVLIGDGESAEIAFEYFTADSPWEVVGFAVERTFRQRQDLFGLPVIDLEHLPEIFPPTEFAAHVALSSTRLNRVRRRLYLYVKSMGYELPSYVSTRAFVWRNVKIGENSFIFENNVLQYFVEIGNNVVLWSGNHVGHRTTIRDHCFITSHCVISGFCDIGESSFLGVNSTFGDRVSVPNDTVVGAGSVVHKALAGVGQAWVGNPVRPLGKSAYDVFEVPEDER